MTDSEPNGDMLDLKPKWPDWLSCWLQLRQIQPDVHQQPSTIIINQHTQSKPKALHHLAPQGDAAKKALLRAFEPSLHHASFPWCLWLWQPHTRQPSLWRSCTQIAHVCDCSTAHRHWHRLRFSTNCPGNSANLHRGFEEAPDLSLEHI